MYNTVAPADSCGPFAADSLDASATAALYPTAGIRHAAGRKSADRDVGQARGSGAMVLARYGNLLNSKRLWLPRRAARPHSGPLLTAALGLAAWLTVCTGCAVPQPRGDGRLQRVVEPTTERGYWLYLPKEYVAGGDRGLRARRWPLVVTFHGMKPFDSARPQAREWQQEADRYGYVVVAPELRAFHLFGQFPLRKINSAFRSDEQATLAILDHVLRTTRADPGNVLSTSWSSGGYMAHYMLNRYPDRFTCLAVRQSNFSATVLNPEITKRSIYHPILILYTQNDFGICKRESQEAVQWYTAHGYKNKYWSVIRNEGHERTPDLAAQFFARVAGVEANSPPPDLVSRQAIDGNAEGIAFLSGEVGSFESPPTPRLASRQGARAGRQTPAPNTLWSPTARAEDDASPDSADVPTPPRRTGAVPRRDIRRSPLKIRVSSAIGIEPLHLAFSVECPTSWHESADFLWTLDGQPIGKGVSGQKTLATAGEHTLGVLVVTAQGEEHRATRTIRVLPRLESTGSSVR